MRQRVLTNASSSSPADELKYRRLEIPINPLYSRFGSTSVTFECIDILAGLSALLTTEGLVKTEKDLLRTQEIRHSKDGSGRRFGRELNSGEFWEKSEKEMLGGKVPVWANVMLLMLLIFIDGTSLVTRGTLSCTPITVSLANFPECIRFTMVRRSVNSRKKCFCTNTALALRYRGRGWLWGSFQSLIALCIKTRLHLSERSGNCATLLACVRVRTTTDVRSDRGTTDCCWKRWFGDINPHHGARAFVLRTWNTRADS
jgi:hypothetical protein